MTIDIIVSRYNEDLSWTLNHPFNKFQYIVYNKGPNENFHKEHIKKIISVPNVGRCDHTYLYHIVENYDNLADINVFFPGSINMPDKKNKALLLLYAILKTKRACMLGIYNKNLLRELYYFKLDFWGATESANFTLNKERILTPAKIRPFGNWYQSHFNNINLYFHMYQGIFSIDKNDVLQHSKEYYQNFVNELSVSSNPEVGHYIERSWFAIFHPIRYTKIIKTNK
jgi:Protein of unknown function (DUF3431)